MNKEKRITLRVHGDMPMSIVGEIVKELPETGITRYKTPIGLVSAYKMEDRKTNIYQIWQEEIYKNG